jgi:hypothetical protein
VSGFLECSPCIGHRISVEKTRYFAPGFVVAVSPFFVAVDIVQPVAVVVAQDGS